MSLRDKPLNEHEEIVVRLREEQKLTCREIGRQLEVSTSRVGQIYAEAKTKLNDFAENGEDALSQLPMRVRRVVMDCEIGSRALARAAIESGRLSWNEGIGSIHWDGAMLPLVSRKTWAVLYEWAGLPLPPPNTDRRQTGPQRLQ